MAPYLHAENEQQRFEPMGVALSERRHILVALLGRTPQILTETLYALCVSQHTAIAEMWAISTQEGQRLAVEKLLAGRHGQFYRLQKDYPAACGSVVFSKKNILVAHDGLLPLADIHSREDSENFLELILRVLWEKVVWIYHNPDKPETYRRSQTGFHAD